jgi:hypothetical protein
LVERSSDMEPLLPHLFWQDCIIATRGYDFRKGQDYLSLFYASLFNNQRPFNNVVLDEFAQIIG